MMVPTAIPAMTPGDKPGRAVVTGGVAVGGEIQFQYTQHLGKQCTGSQKNGTSKLT